MRDRDWELDAACRGGDPEIWFCQGKAAEALAICWACPVREACLEAVLVREHGLGKSARDGIAGGLSAGQRWQLAREQKTAGESRPKRVGTRCREERGTSAGYRRHQRAGEAACDDCRAAYRLYHQAYRLS